MSQPGRTPRLRGSTWRRCARRVVQALTGFVVLVALALLVFIAYLSTRPPAKPVRSLGAISIPTPFRVTRPFIDYMTLHGQKLYLPFASHNLVGVIDTSTSRPIVTI